MSVSIRLASAADEKDALTLIEELFQPPGSRPPDYSRRRAARGFRHALGSPDADVLLAVEGDRIVGLASVYADITSIRYGPRCWLQDLIVSADRRGRAIGRLLLDAAAEWGRGRGCSHLELSSGAGRLDAHRFYRRQGMEQSFAFTRRIE